MSLRQLMAFLLASSMLVLTGCGGAFGGDDDDDSDVETAVALALQAASSGNGGVCGAGKGGAATRQATWAEWAARDDGDANDNAYTFTVYPNTYNLQPSYGDGALLQDFDGPDPKSATKAAVKAAVSAWEVTIESDGRVSIDSDAGNDTYVFDWADGNWARSLCVHEHETNYRIDMVDEDTPANSISLLIQEHHKGDTRGEFHIALNGLYEDVFMEQTVWWWDDTNNVHLSTINPLDGPETSNLTGYGSCYRVNLTSADDTSAISANYIVGNDYNLQIMPGGTVTLSSNTATTIEFTDGAYGYNDFAYNTSWKDPNDDNPLDWYFKLFTYDAGEVDQTLVILLDAPDETDANTQGGDTQEASVSGVTFTEGAEIDKPDLEFSVLGGCPS